MQLHIVPSPLLKATITLPASKSISNRALIINALSGNAIAPQNISACDDTFVMQRALSSDAMEVDIMAAGTAMRFLTAYYAVTPGERVITGTERMRNRPIGILVDALRKLGADITYTEKEGYPPLRIKGGSYRGGELTLPSNMSSQYISALLMIAPMLTEGLRLTLEGGVISRPYIDMTLKMMHDFGAQASWVSENVLEVAPVPYTPTSYLIENDWSAASYWFQMVALRREVSASVVLPGLFAESMQGDAAVQHIFESLGVKSVHTGDGEVCLTNSGQYVTHFEYDFVNQPDLAQTVVVTCAMLGITFRMSGLQSLKIKETDRMAALIAELKKLGYLLREEHNSILIWEGARVEEAADAAIDTYEDHRMAMAFAPCCISRGEIRINEAGVVSKSYPKFWEDMRLAGFQLNEDKR